MQYLLFEDNVDQKSSECVLYTDLCAFNLWLELASNQKFPLSLTSVMEIGWNDSRDRTERL